VLVAGERGGSFAGRVFWGLGLGGIYTFFMNTAQAWPSQPEYQPKWFPGASFRAAVTSEYLGVGYIIGPKVAGILFAGGIVSWLVVMPAIKFFGQLAGNTPIYPSTVPIPQMTPDQLWSAYIRPMGAGAVAAAGLITLIRTIPTITSALVAGLKDLRKEAGVQAPVMSRIERDMPMRTLIFGSAVIIFLMWLLLTFRPIPGARTGIGSNLLAAIIVVIFGFLFVTVASRISGILGNSSNPISGMTIATLMATCAFFLIAGWTAPRYSVLALTIGGVVCIASAIAGATSQDLKTGYLVGATPRAQQWALLVGVTVSTFAVGGTLTLMNTGLEKFVPTDIPLNVSALPEGITLKGTYNFEGKTYRVVNSLGSTTIPDGDYFYDSAAHKIEVQWVHGIGSDKAAAPQARLMATVINGILNRRLPWRLVLMGVAMVLAIELLGVRSLAFAVGSYLSIATTATIFAGGLVRWIVETSSKEAKSGGEASPGALYSSGLIAAGGVFGLLAILINLLQDPEIPNHVPHWLVAVLHLPWRSDLFAFGPKVIGSLAQSNLFGMIMFGLLALSLFHFGRKRLN
jgi:uncharacterized oligopeptide transporter (OPT) family protein